MKSKVLIAENFSLYNDEDYKPYNIIIQSSSNYWHKHAFCNPDGYCIACTGNKYFLDTPHLIDFDGRFSFFFGHTAKRFGVSIYFGYDPATFCGYELRAVWEKEKKIFGLRILSLLGSTEKEMAAYTVEQTEFPTSGETQLIEIARKGSVLSVKIGDVEAEFPDIPVKKGFVGFSRPHFIGTVTFSEAVVSFYSPVEELGLP